MATRDEMMTALRAADAAGAADDARALARMIAATPAQDTSNYSNEGRSHPLVNPDADKGALTRYAAGVSGATDTLRANINDAIRKVLPDNPDRQSIFGGPAMQPPKDQDVEDSIQRSRNRSALYEPSKDQLGTAGFLGDITPEVALTAAPIARTGTAVAKAPLLAKTLGRYAPAAGDIIANAAYSGGKAAAQGKDIGDVAQEAAMGGAGAAGGRVLTRAVAAAATGAKPYISDAARSLVDRGVLPSPGQLFDGPVGSIIRNTEDRVAGYPVIGDVVSYARKRSLGDYGRAETNDAIKPVIEAAGVKPVAQTGAEAIEAAQKKVSDVYDEALDGMFVRPDHVAYTADAMRRHIDEIPLIDAAQKQKIAQYMALRLLPQAQKGVALPGQQAKVLDSEMGHYARQFSRSQNPADRPLGDAFYMLQSNWREAMAAGATEEKMALLDVANAAHKNLLPLVKASDKAVAQGGVFTPNQLQRSYGPYRQTQSDLNAAAQEVLPGRVPDSGTAGRWILGALLTGGAAIPGAAATAAAAGSLLYTKAGMHFFLNGVGGLLPAQTKAYIRSLAPDAAVKYLGEITQKYPHLREGVGQAIQQTAAQAGRMVATQQPQGATQ